MNTAGEKLQGTWNIVTLEVEGMNMGANSLSGSKIVIEGDTFTTISMGTTYIGTFQADDSATPGTFDVRFTEGPHKGNTSLGIYELNGDTWRICLAFAGSDRPTDFVTTAGSGHALETLQRETPDSTQSTVNSGQV